MNKTMQTLLASPYGGRIADYWYDGMYHDVLMKGYCDDYDIGRHTIIDTSIAEVVKRVKRATVCTCAVCMADAP